MFAQALAEKGMLDTLSTEWVRLESWVSSSVEDGRIVWLLLIITFVILFRVSTKR